MPDKNRQVDWNVFWIRQVLVLAVPLLAAVSTVRRDTYLTPQRAGVLLSILLGLTFLNVIWSFFRRSQ